MENEVKPKKLEALLDQIQGIEGQSGSVFFEHILEVAGRRSFGTLLFITGIITLAPLIGDIPGVPTMMGAIVFLVSVQLLMQRKKLWLPQFLLKRSIDRGKLRRALEKLKTPIRYIDKLLRPRLTIFTKGVMVYVIALICLCTALLMPVMEFIPFSANIAGFTLTVYGLALLVNDGLLALLAYITLCVIIGFFAARFLL